MRKPVSGSPDKLTKAPAVSLRLFVIFIILCGIRTRSGMCDLRERRMETGRTKLPELLAPAGGRQAFLGAVKAGADAVYLGGEKFGARAYAENFTREDIVKSIKEAHILGKKVYLTLNVLTKESEMSETMEFAESLYREGLDGAIVQDLGVVSMLRERCPGMEIHASTQMSVTGPDSVRFLKELGVVRVVPARELSLSEIKAIKTEEPVDVECFIHGAMCYSYSGRCLMSSFLGGRSGNRGRCAGTCRLPYKILDENGQYISLGHGKGEQYPLSMRDMCVLEILPDLIDAGIDSFKIEGRMKSPHYAAGVTALYRKYIDRFVQWDRSGRKKPWKVSASDMKKLRSLYLRSELSTGYYYKRNGRDLLTIGKPGYSGTDDEVLEEIEREYLREPLKKQIKGRAVLLAGKPAFLAVSARYGEESVEAEVYGDVVQSALKRPMTEEEIVRRIRKTGDSVFTFSELKVETDGNVFLPVAALNTLRRDALSLLEEKILRMTSPADRASSGTACGAAAVRGRTAPEPACEKSGSGDPAIWAQVMTAEQLEAAQRCGVGHIIAEETPGIMAYLREQKCPGIWLALPHVLRANSLKDMEKLLSESDLFAGFMVRNLEELAFLEKKRYIGQIIGDGSLYQWNRAARDLLFEHCSMLSTGWELSARDLEPLLDGEEDRQLMPVYGRIPMMITAGCVRKTAGQCSRAEKEMYALEDRKGMQFPVRCACEHCYNVIYNSLPLSLHSFVRKGDPVLGRAGGWICSFTTESGAMTEDVLRFYMAHGREEPADRIPEAFTTGHFRKSAL